MVVAAAELVEVVLVVMALVVVVVVGALVVEVIRVDETGACTLLLTGGLTTGAPRILCVSATRLKNIRQRNYSPGPATEVVRLPLSM